MWQTQQHMIPNRKLEKPEIPYHIKKMKFCTNCFNSSGRTCLMHWCLEHFHRNKNYFEEKKSPIPRVYKTTIYNVSASTVSFRLLTSKLPTSKNQVPYFFQCVFSINQNLTLYIFISIQRRNSVLKVDSLLIYNWKRLAY